MPTPWLVEQEIDDAHRSFRTFKQTDFELLGSFRRISERTDLGAAAQVEIVIAGSHQDSGLLQTIEDKPEVVAVLAAEAALAEKFVLRGGPSWSVSVERGEYDDGVSIHVGEPDQTPTEVATTVFAADAGVIPREIMEGITRNLFVDPITSRVSHPTEDLASALLGPSSGLSMKVPGLAEIQLDRKGVQRFRASADDVKGQP